jgi:hypothetical protein
MPLRFDADGLFPRALGAVALAGVDSYLNNRTGQLVSLAQTGDLLDWAVVAADLLMQPAQSTTKAALDAAADAAMYGLASSLFDSRFALASIIPGYPASASSPVVTVAPASALSATGQPASSSSQTVVQTTPIPAASMSAAGDVAMATY